MTEFRQQPRFALEGCGERGGGKDARPECFDGHRPAERDLHGAVLLHDRAATDLLEHVAAVEGRKGAHARGTTRPGGAVLPEAPPVTVLPVPTEASAPRRMAGRVSALAASIAAYFRVNDPLFRWALGPALLVAALLYVRSPLSNYIFDEQEALLANPYVNGEGLGYWDAFRRDFWGLPADRSIGSYRPLPNLIWRLLWQ